jgi:hypothetical protein
VIRNITRIRQFRLRNNIDMPYPRRWVNEVIDSIGNNRIGIIDPKDDKALLSRKDKDGILNLWARTKCQVKIKNWLAVACQSISWDDTLKTNNGYLAIYSHNAYNVFGETYLEEPPQGPGAFIGEIRIQPLDEYKKSQSEDKFKFILAHELVHVFDMMQYLIPAVMNWPAFWKNVLNCGTRLDLLYDRLQKLALFLDIYGSKHELESIKYYWPSQANKWFSAMRKPKKIRLSD